VCQYPWRIFQTIVDKYDIHRILNLMKVTAIIPDELVNNVKAYTQNSTITEAITTALKDSIIIMHGIKSKSKNMDARQKIIGNFA